MPQLSHALQSLSAMTLGTALAVLGVVVLLALALHGWWTTRRARPRLLTGSDAAGSGAGAGDRIEPPLGGEALPAAPDAAQPAPLRGVPPMRRVPRLDALIDAIVPLALEAPVTGELLLMHLPPTRRAGSKPFYIEGLDADSGVWEPPTPGRRYTELQAGVQLANRSGAINEIEYSEFLQKIGAFADAVGAGIDGARAPDMLDVVARARELDAMTTPLDVQLTVTLRANEAAWSLGYLQQVAGKIGFVLGAVPGRLVLPSADEGAPPLLVLAVESQAALAALGNEGDAPGTGVRNCTLTLDVPQTPASAEPFPAWQLAGKQLADDLDATPIDDQGRPINLHAYAAISQELDALYLRLDALDLAAGSAAARRLFS